MILDIVTYGHPALRAKGKQIEQIDSSIHKLAEDMVETMHEADGVGLAAQQVGMPLQLCVLDVADSSKRPSKMWIDGKRVPLADYMPMTLINPKIELLGKTETDVEGCLSFPGVCGDVTRPEKVRVEAINLEGIPITFEATGLLARAVQHEHDHLQGILFIDRMEPEEKQAVMQEYEELS